MGDRAQALRAVFTYFLFTPGVYSGNFELCEG